MGISQRLSSPLYDESSLMVFVPYGGRLGQVVLNEEAAGTRDQSDR